MFLSALKAVDPELAVRRHLSVTAPAAGSRGARSLCVGGQRFELGSEYKSVIVVGAGKASAQMGAAVCRVLTEGGAAQVLKCLSAAPPPPPPVRRRLARAFQLRPLPSPCPCF